MSSSLFHMGEGLMADRIYADFAVLEQGVQDFDRTLKEFESALDALDHQLRTSLSQWTGDARTAFDEFHDLWRKDAVELTRRLAWLRDIISNSHDNYRRSRDVNHKMWDVQ